MEIFFSVEIEIDSEVTLSTLEIQKKITDFCKSNPLLESFYFAFLDDKVFRRFYLKDKIIEYFEADRNEDGEESEIDVEIE